MEDKSGQSRGDQHGQSIVEYFILFAIMAALSLFLVSRQNPNNIRSFFSSYVSKATNAMTTQEVVK